MNAQINSINLGYAGTVGSELREANRDYILAGSPDTPVSVLAKLACSPNPKIRARVAENSATPGIILLQLYSDSDSNVRLSLSNNVNLPFTLLSALSRDRDPDVRYGLAENARMPTAILRKFLADSNPYVVNRAEITLSRLAENAMAYAA